MKDFEICPSLIVTLDGLKMLDMKQRHSVAVRRKMRHRPLWTAKKNTKLSTTLGNFSVVVGSLHVDGLRI